MFKKSIFNYVVQKNIPFIFIIIYSTMSEYELVKKLGSYDNFKGLKSMAKVPRHKLFAQNKLSAPTVKANKGFLSVSHHCINPPLALLLPKCACHAYITFEYVMYQSSIRHGSYPSDSRLQVGLKKCRKMQTRHFFI
jgi:hypothetical protein